MFNFWLITLFSFSTSKNPNHPNANYSWCCEKVSEYHVSWHFLAYLQSNPNQEIEITKHIVLLLLGLWGTEFESSDYSVATRGFNHLFFAEECYR